jgi:hypothetical protein
MMELLDTYEEEHRPIATVGDSSPSRKKPVKETEAAKLGRKIKLCAHNNSCKCKKHGGDCTWGHPFLKLPAARTAEHKPPARTGPLNKVTKVPSDDSLTEPEYGAYEAGRCKFLLYPGACAARRGSKGKGWAKPPPNACGRGGEPFCKPCHCDIRTRKYNEADRKRVRDEAAGGGAAAGAAAAGGASYEKRARSD